MVKYVKLVVKLVVVFQLMGAGVIFITIHHNNGSTKRGSDYESDTKAMPASQSRNHALFVEMQRQAHNNIWSAPEWEESGILEQSISDGKRRLSVFQRTGMAISNQTLHTISNDEGLYNWSISSVQKTIPGVKYSNCDVMNIGLVSATITETRHNIELLQTILVHMPTSLFHLHVYSTDITKHVWRTLLRSWELGSVAATFYTVKTPETKYSDHDVYYNQFRLNAKRLMVLMPNLVALSDIGLFWKNITNANKYKPVFVSAELSGVFTTRHTELGVGTLKKSRLYQFDKIGHSTTDCNRHSEFQRKVPTPWKEGCRAFRIDAALKRRTHVYFWGEPPKSSGEYDVSILTQLSLDRWSHLSKTIANWPGPIHVVFYGTESEVVKLRQLIKRHAALKSRSNIAFHVVYKRGFLYPPNYLRNVALNESTTPYSFILDVDFVPSASLYEKLLFNIQTHMGKDKVLVVPAFDAKENMEAIDIPNEKFRLLEYWAREMVSSFRIEYGNDSGHYPTNYTRWLKAQWPYDVHFLHRYEPYIVVNTGDTQRFDETLMDRMANKISYNYELEARGIKFVVLPDVFILHLPHEKSQGEIYHWNHEHSKKCRNVLFDEFKARVAKTHNYVDQYTELIQSR